MRLIIDTDAGTDDAQAIMLALTHPGVTVEAITTVTGNIHVDKVVPNVLLVLDIMKKNVPVYRGAERPLVANWTPEEKVHGQDGLGDWPERPVCTRTAETEHAVNALIQLVNAAPGEYTLVALGPLTNIALAIQLDPTFPSKIKQLVFMGGTIQAMGNTVNPTAEWNIFCDPEAAFITLRAFPMATMLSWETTMQHPMPWEQYEALGQIPSAAGKFLAATGRLTAEFLRSYQYTGFLLPDPLAMAVALQPDLVQKSAEHYVTVELTGTHTRGQTVIEYLPRPGHLPNVRIVQQIDMDSVYQIFQRALVG